MDIVRAKGLFTVQIAKDAVPGTCSDNLFALLGGTDPVACSGGTLGCEANLGTLNFSVQVQKQISTPEPGSLLLIASVLVAMVAFKILRRPGERILLPK